MTFSAPTANSLQGRALAVVWRNLEPIGAQCFQPRVCGMHHGRNHNAVVPEARGTTFDFTRSKWACQGVVEMLISLLKRVARSFRESLAPCALAGFCRFIQRPTESAISMRCASPNDFATAPIAAGGTAWLRASQEAA